MILLAFGLLMLVSGLVAGYALCYIGTWNKLHAQESQIRSLANDIAVQEYMGGDVPAEWVKKRLEEMVSSEAFR
jgi:hypothetical protein